MKPSPNSTVPHHFLFMLPATATPADQDHVVKAAKELTSMGYVYVASAHERTMEDRDNVRFMPLKSDDLPRFGSLAGVMIVRDQEMARVAQEAYPEANIMVIDPTPAAEKTPETPRPARRTAATAWHPLMASSGVPHAA
jgi:hypothetical protein